MQELSNISPDSLSLCSPPTSTHVFPHNCPSYPSIQWLQKQQARPHGELWRWPVQQDRSHPIRKPVPAAGKINILQLTVKAEVPWWECLGMSVWKEPEGSFVRLDFIDSRVCLFPAVKHYMKYANIPPGVFKHVFGKDQAIETLVQIILAVPLERGEKRLRKGSRRDRVNYGRSGREWYRIIWKLDSSQKGQAAMGQEGMPVLAGSSETRTQLNLRGEIKGKCISSLIWEGHLTNSQKSELREPGLRRGRLPDTKLLLSPSITITQPCTSPWFLSSQRQACSTQYRRRLTEVLTSGPYTKRTSFYAPFTNFK